MKTFSARQEDVKHDWYLIDASGKTLGRLSTEIARRLKGKHKPEYTPHVDTGDYVVVVNADKIRVTGNKRKDKIYYRHTGYIGNLKSVSLEKLLQEKPERALQQAVKGMLPRSPLGRKMFSKLKVFAGPEHPHQAQQPKPLDVRA
jgi:large subunit ribosomal protein L13